MIALDSSGAADDFVNLLNLVNSFLNYEALLAKDNQNDSNPNVVTTQGNNVSFSHPTKEHQLNTSTG